MAQEIVKNKVPFFFRTGSLISLVVAAVLLVGSPFIITNLFENLDANEVMVIQSPVDGTLAVYTDPGVKYQGFGKVTKYPRRAQYAFVSGKGADEGTSKRLRFNDGGHANLSGSVSWEMPLKPDAIIAIHKTFGSAEGVDQQAVAKMIDTAVYLAGPLMSSTESSGERRSELVQAINDQAENGAYVTRVVEKQIKDPITGQTKSITATEIVRDDKGNPKRQQGSILGEFGIKLLPLSISELRYDKIVEDQIAQRQKATTEVQIAQATSKKAEQDAITAAKIGEADAAKAKWKQETIKAQVVTEAEQKLAVATLGAKEAEQYKRDQILRGEGDAQRRQLVMTADGALEKKLEAYVEVQKAWADAYAKSPNAQVPSVVFGGNGTGQTAQGGAQNLLDMLAVKTAREMGVDMSTSGKEGTAKRK